MSPATSSKTQHGPTVETTTEGGGAEPPKQADKAWISTPVGAATYQEASESKDRKHAHIGSTRNTKAMRADNMVKRKAESRAQNRALRKQSNSALAAGIQASQRQREAEAGVQNQGFIRQHDGEKHSELGKLTITPRNQVVLDESGSLSHLAQDASVNTFADENKPILSDYDHKLQAENLFQTEQRSAAATGKLYIGRHGNARDKLFRKLGGGARTRRRR